MTIYNNPFNIPFLKHPYPNISCLYELHLLVNKTDFNT